MEAFSDALRREMHPWGIQVSIMEPGAFKTQMNNSSVREIQLKEGWHNLNNDLKEEYGENYLEKSRLTVRLILVTYFTLTLLFSRFRVVFHY